MPWGNGPATLYHGTVIPHAPSIQRRIDLSRCWPQRDFGRGFYTTPIRDQAVIHANKLFQRMAARYYNKRLHYHPIGAAVLRFHANLDLLSRCTTLTFVVANEEWKDFVEFCRNNGQTHSATASIFYDLVSGPVANHMLKPFRGYGQMSFHSDASAKLLVYQDMDQGGPLI